jgi:HPt (histidine-containing phosphotransfer) domain-containing protein
MALINWREALETVNDDKEFLQEVLEDLVTELCTAKEEITAAVKRKDFESIMKAAHRVKGSASYLACHPLKDCAFNLQQMGHNGSSDADLEEIIDEFTKFKKLVEDTEEEMKNMP